MQCSFLQSGPSRHARGRLLVTGSLLCEATYWEQTCMCKLKDLVNASGMYFLANSCFSLAESEPKPVGADEAACCGSHEGGGAGNACSFGAIAKIR